MGIFKIVGQDADSNPPNPNPYVPLPQPKYNPPKGANADDGGALWWDHDDPGANGGAGPPGQTGEPGFQGVEGGDGPAGVSITISNTLNGSFPILIGGGRGQPGGKGGVGGQGAGQDGGDSDDEQPAGAGGPGGIGGMGGIGGPGGRGGISHDVDITIGSGIDVSLISVTYTRGSAA